MARASRCWEERQQNCLASTADNQMAPLMTNWIETFRGAVPPWQCDVTEHFTIAYYFDRLEEAEANLADELGFSDLLRRGDLPRRVNARFARELRAGASFHVESAALNVDNRLRLGHRV